MAKARMRARGHAFACGTSQKAAHPLRAFLLEPLEIRAYARGILAQVTLADTRERTHINTTARCGGGDSNNNVVLEAEPRRRVRCFDPSLGWKRGNNVPTKGARTIQRALKYRIGRFT